MPRVVHFEIHAGEPERAVDRTLARALQAGGSLALGKMPIPGVGWPAYAKDTEGNTCGMMQSDTAAA